MKVTENLDVMVEPRQIVVGTDLRDSRYLLPIAIAQAKVTNSHLTLVHTFVNPAMSSISTHGLVPPGCGMDPEEFAERILADLAKRAHAEGVMCDSVLRQGCSVVEALRDEIHNTDAQRAIIGTRGIRSAAQQVLGPVASNVLRSLEVPVLAVSPRARNAERFGVPRRILHPVSFRDSYKEDFQVACRLAELYSAELVLLHAIDKGSLGTRAGRHTSHDPECQFDTLVGDPYMPAGRVQTMVVCGDVAGEILQSASIVEADWIMLGWCKKADYRAFTESTAHRVIAEASVPVFTLPRHPQHSTPDARQMPVRTGVRI